MAVYLTFYFERQLYHYGTRRNSNVVKPGSDVWHTKAEGIMYDYNFQAPDYAHIVIFFSCATVL